MQEELVLGTPGLIVSYLTNERKEDFTFFYFLDIILQALESSPPELHSSLEQSSPQEQPSPQEQQQIDSDLFSLDYDGSFLDGFSDLDSSNDEVVDASLMAFFTV